MTTQDAMRYVGHVVDTALSSDRSREDAHIGARLVGWQCGFEPMFVLIIDAYDGNVVDEEEAEEIATMYLNEIGWFDDGKKVVEHPDYNLAVDAECLPRPTFEQTKLDTWFERDRAHVNLIDKRTDTTLIEWWDEEVHEAVECGFLSDRGYIMGRNMDKNYALHESAFNYWLSMQPRF